MTLGQTIKAAREKRGLSVRKLAATLGVTPACASYWERDVYIPRIRNLLLLEHVLEFEDGELLRKLGDDAQQSIPDAERPAAKGSKRHRPKPHRNIVRR